MRPPAPLLLAAAALCLIAIANAGSAQETVPAPAAPEVTQAPSPTVTAAEPSNTPPVAAPSASDTPAPAAAAAVPTSEVPAPAASVQPEAPAKVKLREGTGVKLTFAQTLNSSTAEDGDRVEFVLAEDLKVGDVVVARAGSKAFGEVSNARPSGMLGKSGELNIRMDYLAAGDIRIPLRETQGDDSGSSRALNPIGLIKHGKEVEIPQGAPLKAYVSDDVMLLPESQAAH